MTKTTSRTPFYCSGFGEIWLKWIASLIPIHFQMLLKNSSLVINLE